MNLRVVAVVLLSFTRCVPAVATQKIVKLRPLTAELSTFSLVDAQRRTDLVQVCGLIGC